jgi:uncharacterized protein DUF5681
MAKRNPSTRSLANLKPFKKGQSGNPGGRPKSHREITQLALEGSEHAIRRLIALTSSKDERVALSACIAVLDRGIGKPVQTVAGDAANPIAMGGKIEMVVVDPKPTIDRPPEETREQWIARRTKELGLGAANQERPN